VWATGVKMIRKLSHLFKDSGQITAKDLKDFYRDRARIISFIIMPIFMMLLTGYIFPSQSALKGVPVGVVNLDNGAISQNMVEQLNKLKSPDSNQEIMVIKRLTDREEIKELIQEENLNGAIIFPSGFTSGLLEGKKGQVTIITDQSNPQISSILDTMLETAFRGMGTRLTELKLNELMSGRLSQPQIATLATPLAVKTEGIVPGNPNYFQFVAPGIIAMVTMFAVMMGLAGSVSREKEQGTLDGILVAPVSRFSIIMGKTGAQSVRGIGQGMMVLVLAMVFFHVKVYGNFLLMLLIIVLGIFSFIGLGILVSAAAEEQETAMTILMTVTFPMLFLSGAFFPVQQMPGFMQAISKLFPITYMVEALRQVIVLGAGLYEVLRPILILLGFGVVTLAISIPAFKRVVTS
jgi:ABC-2 type transport system permease protein